MSSAVNYATGLALLALLAALAKKYKALDTKGVIAALTIGLILLVSNWIALALLMVFFLSSSALTLFKYKEKERLGTAERKGGRSASQVLCSGAVPAVLAAFSPLIPEHEAQVLLAVASVIAYANADTWASEIGALSRSQPFLIVNPRTKVPPGVSGGVTLLGEVGAASGSALVALTYSLLTGENALPVLLLGWTGEVVDAILGAVLQVKYECPRCRVLWDHPVHVCGSETVYLRGYRWIKNEVVNLVTELAIALAAFLTSLRL